VPEQTVAPPPTPQQIAEAQARTLAQLRRSIGRERIRHYAAELLREQDEVRVGTLPMQSAEQLPLLIYLRQYGDGSLGYRTEELEGDWIERDGIGFRDFIVRKV
jgi:hypothetical protein